MIGAQGFGKGDGTDRVMRWKRVQVDKTMKKLVFDRWATLRRPGAQWRPDSDAGCGLWGRTRPGRGGVSAYADANPHPYSRVAQD